MSSMPREIERSWWEEVDPPLQRPALERDLETEVCIVGGGAAGLTTAYLLALEGRRVAVLESADTPAGDSRLTMGHLMAAVVSGFLRVERLRGADAARLALASHNAAIDMMESIVADQRIECQFVRVDGYLIPAPGDGAEALDRELDAAWRAGFGSVKRLGPHESGDFRLGPCLQFPHQAQVFPVRYLQGLAQAIERKGGSIFGQSPAASVQGGANPVVETEAGALIRCKSVVIAADTGPLVDTATDGKKRVCFSHVIAARVPRGSIPPGIYWETGISRHQARLAAAPDSHKHEILLVEGERHTNQADESIDVRRQRLESWARQRFPMIESIERSWSSPVIESADGLGFIGRHRSAGANVFLASGDSSMGLTHGTIAGMILADQISGRPNDWEALYDPAR